MIEFCYRQTGSDCWKLFVFDDEKHYAFWTNKYTHTSTLAVLVSAANNLLDGQEATVYFSDHQEAPFLTLKRRRNQEALLDLECELRSYRDDGKTKDNEYDIVHTGFTTVLHFASSVLGDAEAIRAEIGDSGFACEWSIEFPADDELEKLRDGIALERSKSLPDGSTVSTDVSSLSRNWVEIATNNNNASSGQTPPVLVLDPKGDNAPNDVPVNQHTSADADPNHGWVQVVRRKRKKKQVAP